jgi:hypothetical protein
MAREELDNLLSTVIPFAQKMLSKHGTFFPFGSALAANGEIKLVGSNEDKPNLGAEDVIHMLLEGFRASARAGDYKAIASCVDVRIDSPDGSGKTDAIRVTLEEDRGEAVNVFMPYQKRMLRGIKYGNVFASAVEKSVFV